MYNGEDGVAKHPVEALPAEIMGIILADKSLEEVISLSLEDEQITSLLRLECFWNVYFTNHGVLYTRDETSAYMRYIKTTKPNHLTDFVFLYTGAYGSAKDIIAALQLCIDERHRRSVTVLLNALVQAIDKWNREEVLVEAISATHWKLICRAAFFTALNIGNYSLAEKLVQKCKRKIGADLADIWEFGGDLLMRAVKDEDLKCCEWIAKHFGPLNGKYLHVSVGREVKIAEALIPHTNFHSREVIRPYDALFEDPNVINEAGIKTYAWLFARADAYPPIYESLWKYTLFMRDSVEFKRVVEAMTKTEQYYLEGKVATFPEIIRDMIRSFTGVARGEGNVAAMRYLFTTFPSSVGDTFCMLRITEDYMEDFYDSVMENVSDMMYFRSFFADLEQKAKSRQCLNPHLDDVLKLFRPRLYENIQAIIITYIIVSDRALSSHRIRKEFTDLLLYEE